jgi:hypothetical protein
MVKKINELIDAPPSFLLDPTVNPKVRTMEGEGVGSHSLAHSTSRVEGHARVPGWTRKIDKQFIYSYGPAQTKQQVG